MTEMIQKALVWKVVIAKCAMLTFISMGTLLVAATQNWTDEYVATLGWYHWTALVISVLVNGCITINSFIDKTFSAEGIKIGLDAQVKVAQDKADAKIEEIKQEVVDAKQEAKEEKEKIV